jgi:hypothetical protein
MPLGKVSDVSKDRIAFIWRCKQSANSLFFVCLIMRTKAVRSCETSGTVYPTTRRNIFVFKSFRGEVCEVADMTCMKRQKSPLYFRRECTNPKLPPEKCQHANDAYVTSYCVTQQYHSSVLFQTCPDFYFNSGNPF